MRRLNAETQCGDMPGTSLGRTSANCEKTGTTVEAVFLSFVDASLTTIFTEPKMNFSIPENLDFQQYCFEKHGSIENLIDKAKKGEIVAQADLGIAYSEGFGDLLPKDEDKAIGWLNAAVERGYELPAILEKLGELLDLKGTTLCQRKAYEMYHRAAELGSTNAQINVAEMYRCGVEGVVNEDLKEAFKWYKMAADEDESCLEGDTFRRLFAGTMKILGNTLGGTKLTALKLLNKYYREGDCPEGQPQPAKAIYYLTRAAELGDVEAQLELGQTYLTGNGTSKDIAKARRWLGKASANGDIRAKQVSLDCMGPVHMGRGWAGRGGGEEGCAWGHQRFESFFRKCNPSG